MKETVTRRIRVYGIVQGVGFRPTVSRHATTCNIHGSVSNKGPYVEIFAQAPEAQVDRFVTMIREQSPKRAAILKMNIEDVENPEIYKDFQIVESEKTKGEIFVSPDIAICEECKEEMYQPGNRRYLHPFINCTCCGPRLNTNTMIQRTADLTHSLFAAIIVDHRCIWQKEVNEDETQLLTPDA